MALGPRAQRAEGSIPLALGSRAVSHSSTAVRVLGLVSFSSVPGRLNPLISPAAHSILISSNQIVPENAPPRVPAWTVTSLQVPLNCEALNGAV